MEEQLSCPNCGHSCALLLKANDLNRNTSREQFCYHRCTACGLVYESPIPANLGAYYPSDYPQYAIPKNLDELRQRAIATESRVSFVQQLAPNGKLLEVGAGFGAFSYMAQQRGFEVEAVEMDHSCCDYMNGIGIKAICGSICGSVEKLLGEYDVIAMWHVIEHLENYQNAIAVLARHLSPGGILVICAPNPTSLQFKLFGRYWVSLDAPRHLWLIPLPVLAACAARSGLETAFASTSDREALIYNKWCWEASLSHVMICAGLMPRLGIRAILNNKNGSVRGFFEIARRVAFKLFVTMVARVLNLLLAPLERSNYRGTSYSVVFRKPCAPQG